MHVNRTQQRSWYLNDQSSTVMGSNLTTVALSLRYDSYHLTESVSYSISWIKQYNLFSSIMVSPISTKITKIPRQFIHFAKLSLWCSHFMVRANGKFDWLSAARTGWFFHSRERKKWFVLPIILKERRMNWDQAENVIPDLVKMELVKSDERFSNGIQEVLQVNT